MTKNKLCLKCQKEINISKDKYVNLKTLQGKKQIEDVYFHYNCWLLYFKECVEKKVTKLGKFAFDKIKEITGVNPADLKNFLPNLV